MTLEFDPAATGTIAAIFASLSGISAILTFMFSRSRAIADRARDIELSRLDSFTLSLSDYVATASNIDMLIMIQESLIERKRISGVPLTDADVMMQVLEMEKQQAAERIKLIRLRCQLDILSAFSYHSEISEAFSDSFDSGNPSTPYSTGVQYASAEWTRIVSGRRAQPAKQEGN